MLQMTHNGTNREIGEETMTKATSIRISNSLYFAADKAGNIQKRSIAKQVELWAELGKSVERLINIEDVFAIIQGLKKINVSPIVSKRANPQDVFRSLENNRKNKSLSDKVTTTKIYFEASLNSPGLLDRVDSQTGERLTGQFVDGKFLPK